MYKVWPHFSFKYNVEIDTCVGFKQACDLTALAWSSEQGIDEVKNCKKCSFGRKSIKESTVSQCCHASCKEHLWHNVFPKLFCIFQQCATAMSNRQCQIKGQKSVTDSVTGREGRRTREKTCFRNEPKCICGVSKGWSKGVIGGSHFRIWQFFCFSYRKLSF